MMDEETTEQKARFSEAQKRDAAELARALAAEWPASDAHTPEEYARAHMEEAERAHRRRDAETFYERAFLAALTGTAHVSMRHPTEVVARAAGIADAADEVMAARRGEG